MLVNILLFVVLKGVLDYTYVHAVSPLYAYAGLTTDISVIKIILSYVALILLVYFLPRNTETPSGFSSRVLLAFLIIPILSLWGLQNESTIFLLLTVTSFAFLEFLLKIKVTGFGITRVRNIENHVLVVTWLMVGALFIHFIARGGLHYLNFNFLNVYKLRQEVATQLLQGGWGYLYSFSGKSLLIVLMCIALWKKRWVMFATSVLAEILVFALTTHKEFVFYPFIVVFVYFCSVRGFNVSRVFALALCFVIVAAVIVSNLTGNNLYLGVLVYRSFDTIGYNQFAYYHFFQSHPYVFFSNSFLSPFISFPYPRPVAEIIGYGRYGAGSDAFMNAGYIASGYMEAGAIGVYVYTVIIALLMKVADALTLDRMPVWVGTGIMVISLFQLVNSNLTTALLTGGIGLSLLALWLIGSQRQPDHESVSVFSSIK